MPIHVLADRFLWDYIFFNAKSVNNTHIFHEILHKIQESFFIIIEIIYPMLSPLIMILIKIFIFKISTLSKQIYRIVSYYA